MVLTSMQVVNRQAFIVSVDYDPTDGGISDFEVLLHPGGQNLTELLESFGVLENIIDQIDWKEQYQIKMEDDYNMNHIKYFENENE